LCIAAPWGSDFQRPCENVKLPQESFLGKITPPDRPQRIYYRDRGRINSRPLTYVYNELNEPFL
ncbi:hypothetical protein NPIL_270121, partial [Nephila pilipes]